MSKLRHPLISLNQGNWFKLICGASYQHLPAVRNLTLAYALAGVDCVDVAADSAIIAAAREALSVAHHLAHTSSDSIGGENFVKPWLMVSLNDGEDPHFRKAEFDPHQCPTDCPQPCEAICPTQAIVLNPLADGFSGVVETLCYGCGRCLSVCPIQQINTRSYVSTPAAIAPLLLEGIDAIEIHTQVGRQVGFKRLWQAIEPGITNLKAISISCPDGEGLIDYLWSLYEIMGPLSAALLWQTDGRPMSGDIGDGATQATIKLSQKVLAAGLPGYVQLAGGTNRYTVSKLTALGLLKPSEREQADNLLGDTPRQTVAGVAYGSYARILLTPILENLESNPMSHADQTRSTPNNPHHKTSPQRRREPLINRSPSPLNRLEDEPDLLRQAVHLAQSLVFKLKRPNQGRVEIGRPSYSTSVSLGIPLQT